jgi:formamidopyrimidine-DNA glycosylase
MPELPDITVYVEALEERARGRVLKAIRLTDMFVLRTAIPPIDSLVGLKAIAFRRIGKRVVVGFENGWFVVIHLMVSGRLHWAEAPSKPLTRNVLIYLVFDSGTLTLTEASSKRRASIHVVAGEAGLAALDPGGLELSGASFEAFKAALTAGNHTLKRTLTDPRTFSGIGNAYSDEILHAAKLSPVALSQKLTDPQIRRLQEAAVETMRLWTGRLRAESAKGFPERVTAFRPEMAVHGKFGKPCPVCATLVQRITYAENEVNYCPRCQTGGKLLADRSLSRLLKSDWPKTIEEWEERKESAKAGA